MNTITIELCAEDRARLDKILEALMARPDCTLCAKQVVDYCTQVTGVNEYGAKVEPEAPAEPEHPVENPFPEPVTQKEPEKPTAPAVTKSDVQQKVVALSAAGKKAEVREIVHAYAERVSGIPEDKLPEVMAKLNALEG